MLDTGAILSVCVVGVSLKDRVWVPSSNIGCLVLLWSWVILFLVEASIGGDQLLELLASMSILFWKLSLYCEVVTWDDYLLGFD